jgi:hypothetical protein
MKAAVTTDDKDSGGFEVVDLPDPTPEPGQLIIRVKACGVCGSDIKAEPFAPAGMVMGHELGGEVVAVGAHTDDWSEGTNVAVLPVISCGSCQYCRAGLVSHCPKASYIGMGPAGGFAEYAAVPGRHCFTLPAEVPANYSALVEPFAVGLHGVHSAEIGRGDDVLIVGAGGVGLTTLVWACKRAAAVSQWQIPIRGGVIQRVRLALPMCSPPCPKPNLGLMTRSSNASGVPSLCRPASRRCGHGVASSFPVPVPSRPPSSPSRRYSRNSPSGTPSPTRSTNSARSSPRSATEISTRPAPLGRHSAWSTSLKPSLPSARRRRKAECR